REYDPVKLGYVSDPTNVPASEQSRIFKFDTRIAGNSNHGHLYGTKLNPTERAALLEFLKVMDPPDRFAQKSGRSSAGAGVEEVPETEAADIEELKGLQLEQMKMEAALKHAKPVDRGQHPKHHGFLIARFTVADNIPAELRAGLFREPKTY